MFLTRGAHAPVERFAGLGVIGGLLLLGVSAHAEQPSNAEMWRMIQAQQREIESLKSQLKATDEKAEAVTEAVEAGGGAAKSASSEPGWWQNTQLGAYGELHYNGGDKDEIDFHRFVVLMKHQFNDDIRLVSEVELEHTVSGGDEPGEVELEQAYVEFDLAEEHRSKLGLFLVPVGMLNEHHEPTTFFGVERNPVENNIIPTTWWEAGVGFNGELPANFKYDLAFHSGLNTATDGDGAFLVRGGRQKVARAKAKDGAVTGRLLWNGTAGVQLGASANYQQDVTQGNFSEEVSAVMWATHADIRQGPFGLRALYASWNLDSDAADVLGRDEQAGWFVEPAYYFSTSIGEMGLFARYNAYDNEAGAGSESEYEQIDLGMNFWPHENVVLKADFAFLEAPDGKKDDEILNLGVGFSF